MNGNRIALSAALLATTGLVPVSAASAQDTGAASQAAQVEDTIVVRYQYVPDDKRATSEVSSFLSVDDIAVTGDSDIASALGRVTGLSVQDGRFVIVRGLNERYSNTLINGSPLSSPEPLRRAVPLDLFPTSLISNILVQKTFSPQFPGEFGGGLVEIETSTLPDDGFLELSFGAAADTATSFDEGLLHDGGNHDWTGFGDDTRDWPSQFEDVFATQNIGAAEQDPTTLATIGRNLENARLWVVQEGDIPGDVDVNLEAGDRFDFDGFSVGVLGSIGYDNSWETLRGTRGKARVSSTGLSARTQFDRVQTTNTIESNAMAGVGVEAGDHEVRALAFVLRSTDKDTQILEGRDDDRNADLRIDSTAWFERQVYTYQLSGDHTFDIGQGLNLDWRASTSDASREAPNGREAIYEDEDQSDAGVDYRLLNSIDGNSITFSRVDDVTDDLGFDVSLPTTLFGMDWEWTAGYSTMDKERTAYTREFGFEGSIPAALADSRIDYIFADQNILDTRFRLREIGGILTPEAYRGELAVDAWHVGSDIELTPFLRAAVGARFEDGEQIVDTFGFPVEPTDSGLIETRIEEDYVLPAATLTWTFADNLQLRLGYSETITRPQFRELGFAEFFNTETDERFRGNPYLVNTEITNFDARLEYYFGRDQFVTAGVFHKDLDRPIVEYILPEGETLATSFINGPSATLTGFELEYEQTFDLAEVYDGAFWQDAEVFVKANYTYTSSEMSAGEDESVIVAIPSAGEPTQSVEGASGYINDGQTLQGQSEHLANLQLGWENSDSRTALLFNYTGERTRALANVARGLPEVVEEPPFLVDLVHSREFELNGGDYLDVRFAVRNLLGEDYVATQSASDTSLTVDAYEIGTTFSISVSRSF